MADGNNELPIDLDVLQTLETKSEELYKQFTEQLERIQQQTRLMSSTTAEAGKVYNLAVKNWTEELNASTTKTINLITHCDELDKDLSQLQELSRQIKIVDKALDQLQQALTEKKH